MNNGISTYWGVTARDSKPSDSTPASASQAGAGTRVAIFCNMDWAILMLDDE